MGDNHTKSGEKSGCSHAMPEWLQKKRDEWIRSYIKPGCYPYETLRIQDYQTVWNACHAEMQKENESLKDQLKWSLKNEEKYKRRLFTAEEELAKISLGYLEKWVSGPTETAAKKAWRRVAELEEREAKLVEALKSVAKHMPMDSGAYPCLYSINVAKRTLKELGVGDEGNT